MKKEKKKKSGLLSVRLLFTTLILFDLMLVLLIAWLVSKLGRWLLPISIDIPDLFWFYAVSILVGGAIAYCLTNWFLKPLVNLGQAMRQVAQGDYSVRLKTEKGLKEIREINANFNLMAKELGATEILQTDFVSNVSHEFKTPISAIEGYATLLQGCEGQTEEQTRYVEKILTNTRRLSTLVGNILLLSRVDTQAIAAKQTSYRLDEQIRQSILMLETEWTKKDIEFDVELDEVEYMGNENLMYHVWNNLIGNAVKFSPEGGLVGLRLEEMDGRILFTIEDEGCGIPEDAQKHIFDKFYQADNSHKEEGNGLGLALVKKILKVSGGEIHVKNRPEGGCRFTVILSAK